MAKKIALFNHKSGVGKTTTTFNLGWTLAEKGKKVVVVDTDPQCDLTELVLGYDQATDLQDFYEKNPNCNIYAGLKPAFEAQPRAIRGLDCYSIKNRIGMFLLPGHLRLSEYEVKLAYAQQFSNSIHTVRNLPGALTYLLNETAEKLALDYIIIDMNSSLSAFNQNILMTSDYFIIPFSSYLFSELAIDSIVTIFHRWQIWSKYAQKQPALQTADYPYPLVTPKFLGTIIREFHPRESTREVEFSNRHDAINKRIIEKLCPAMKKLGMMIAEAKYPPDYCLAQVPDINTLLAKSKEYQTPVFSLIEEQLEDHGRVLERNKEKKQEFFNIFSEIADRILSLTDG